MAPTIHFLGVGTALSRGLASEGGFLIQTHNCTVLVDPGRGAAEGLDQLKIKEIDSIILSGDERGSEAPSIKKKKKPNADVTVEHKKGTLLFHLPDASVGYVFDETDFKGIACDVLILGNHTDHEKALHKLKPKLAILTNFDSKMLEDNPLYLARTLQQKTGIQTIAAQDGLAVDLVSYSALSAQKALSKF